MKYVPPLGSVDPDAAYQNGNPSAGIPGSIVPAAAIEHPQRELLHVILKAGLTPDEDTLTQLYEAIVKIVGVEVPLASVMEAGLVKIGARVHTGSRPAQVLNGKPLTQSAYATATPPPDAIPTGYAARWTGTKWDLVEDHRQHLDSTGTKQGGTPYWMPSEGDDWQSQPRYTEDLGPLPDGAVTVRPEKPLSVVKEEKEREVRSACDAAIIASLTMPAVRPSATEVSVAAASLAAVDPDGPDTLLALHAARRDELLALVRAADSIAAVQAVEVSYAI